MYRISVHIALGDSAQALTAARRVRQQQELPDAERYARFCVDLARAWALHGRADRAAEALLCAGRHAPKRCGPSSRSGKALHRRSQIVGSPWQTRPVPGQEGQRDRRTRSQALFTEVE